MVLTDRPYEHLPSHCITNYNQPVFLSVCCVQDMQPCHKVLCGLLDHYHVINYIFYNIIVTCTTVMIL